MKTWLLVAVCAGIAGCMHAELQPQTAASADLHVMGHTGEPTDTATVQALQKSLAADPELGTFALDVDAKEGLVVLSGVAPSALARARAERLARALPHVTGVVNDLQVKAG